MRVETRTDWHARVDQSVRNMLANLDNKTQLEAIAAEAASSPWHFQRMFRTLTGETPDNCLRRLKMERAPYLLRSGTAKVIDVALESGYDTPEAFTRAFVRAWGLSPRELKKLPHWSGSLPSPAGIHFNPNDRERWYFVGPQGDSGMQTKIVMMERKRLIGISVADDPWQLPHAWSRLNPLLQQFGLNTKAKAWLSTLQPAGAPLPGSRFAAAIAVDDLPDGPSCPAELEEWVLPEGLCAVIVHFGSTEDLGVTVERWEKDWLPASSWEADPDRPRWEWYQNSNVPPELQLTFWCAPVRKLS